MQYSIVIPYLKNSTSIKLCLKYLKENSYYNHEIVEVVDETDVYFAFNKGVYQSTCDTVVLLNDDMIVSKHWDKFIPKYANEQTILTGYVVEPRPGKIINGPTCIKQDCGDLHNFSYDKFQTFVNENKVPEVIDNSKGWYQPLVVNRKSFVTYPNLNKFPLAQNDCLLVDDILPALGYKFQQIDMYVYHFQSQSIKNQKRKRCIISYSNFQVDSDIPTLQKKVIDKFNNIPNCDYKHFYFDVPDGELWHDQVIDHAFNKLFYEYNYDTILLLDIDCIPLSSYSLEYVFKQAEKNILIGNAQRANHIENDKHVYVAPSAICITKEMYEHLEKPSFRPSARADVGEEITFIAQQKNVYIEMLMPHTFEALPYRRTAPWPLADHMPEYGIGTTFVNKDGKEMFYHLFQSSMNLYNNNFFYKCAKILLQR